MSHYALALSLLLIATTGAVVLCIYLLRHWFSGRLRKTYRLYALTDPTLTRPARLHLHRIESILSTSSLFAIWTDYEALGFQVWSDLGDRGNAFLHARLAYHPMHRLALILVEDLDGLLQGSVLAVGEDNRVEARGHGYESALNSEAICWLADFQRSPEQCIREVLEATFSMPLRTLTESSAARVWRRVYGLLADVAIAQGPPTRESIQSFANLQTATVSSSIIEATYLHSHNLWRHRMVEAALDHWRRTVQIEFKAWKNLESRLHVVDANIEPQDILELFSGGKARRYLNRLHSEERLSGIALYDAMRMRLAPDLQLLGAVQRPVEARIYGPPSAIESRA